MSAPTPDELWALSSFAGTFTMIEHAIQMLQENEFNDAEIRSFLHYEPQTRMRLRLRLIELFESLRESLVALDERLQQLAELQGAST